MMVNLRDFIIQSNLFKTIDVPDLLLVHYQCFVEEEVSEIWSHESYIAYVLGGEKMWKSSDEEVRVTSDQAIFVSKGATTVHQYFDEPFMVLFIFFSDALVMSLLQSKLNQLLSRAREKSNKNIIRLPAHPLLTGYFHSLLMYLSNPEKIDPILVRHKVEELLIFLCTQSTFSTIVAHILDSASSRNLRPLMEAHYQLPLKVADYARLSARSVSTFRRDFEHEFGMSPSRWLLEKRLDLSKILIESLNEPIESIAEKSGFANRTHFSRVFKERFGVAPSQVR